MGQGKGCRLAEPWQLGPWDLERHDAGQSEHAQACGVWCRVLWYKSLCHNKLLALGCWPCLSGSESNKAHALKLLHMNSFRTGSASATQQTLCPTACLSSRSSLRSSSSSLRSSSSLTSRDTVCRCKPALGTGNEAGDLPAGALYAPYCGLMPDCRAQDSIPAEGQTSCQVAGRAAAVWACFASAVHL